MKTIGLIGGMSWESTMAYYRILNEQVNQRLGGYHSARCLIFSVDFAEIEASQRVGDWERAAGILADAAWRLERSGAELILIATNTMHKVFDRIQEAVKTPLVHMADAAAEAIRMAGLTRVSLLGTKYTMEQEFYKDRLYQGGVEVLIPSPKDREIVNDVIFNELCRGKVLTQSRAIYQRIIEELAAAGAQGVLLGCTEIGSLIRPEDSTWPLFDTTLIHAAKAVALALK